MAATRGARSPSVQQAFVLHHYDWSETSLVLDLFTREQGRLAVVAKGAKRPYSQLRAVLLPFQRIQVGLSRPAKGEAAAEVSTLRSAEWVGGHTLPAGAALFSAYYLNELLLKFLARQDPHPALFEAYAQTLARLDEPALRAFELRLLAEVGLLPDLSLSGTRQTPLELERLYTISPETGVLAAEAENPAALRGASLVQLEAALLHGSPAALHQACEGAPAQALRAVLRGLLQYHLGHKPLRTRQVLLDVQKLME